eukprot:353440-Chlamydomonas_euryale.AAC.6
MLLPCLGARMPATQSQQSGGWVWNFRGSWFSISWARARIFVAASILGRIENQQRWESRLFMM